MGAYILRRLLLIIPTLLGIMIVNFALVQFVPGGPVEQAIARAQGQGDVFGGFAGTDGESTLDQDAPQNDQYIGARGLPPEFIEQLEKEGMISESRSEEDGRVLLIRLTDEALVSVGSFLLNISGLGDDNEMPGSD